jgi:uncharacterized OsmC-like protein
MRGQPERRFEAHLERERGFRFRSQAGEDGLLHGEPYASDEPDPVGDASAPSTPSLLASALGHCLSAALIEVSRRAHLEVTGCATDVVAVVRPNDQGLPRIHRVEVTIRPSLAQMSPRSARCEEVFEQYCTVTASVRAGIEIVTNVDWQSAGPSEPASSSAGADDPVTLDRARKA